MATVMELIGLSPMGTAAVPQVDPRKNDVAFRCGQVIMDAVQQRIASRAISCTRPAFENAIAGVAATGGSTNAVLHLLAMAREAGVQLADRRFPDHQRAHAAAGGPEAGRASSSPPTSTRRAASPVIAKRLVDGGYVDGSALTVHRRDVRRGSRRGEGDSGAGSDPAAEQSDQDDRRAGDPEGHAGARGLRDQSDRASTASSHRGPARVFDREEDAMQPSRRGEIKPAMCW